MTFDQPKSIVSIALAYPTRIHEEVPLGMKTLGAVCSCFLGGSITMIYSRDRLNRLIEFIKTRAEKWQKEEEWRLAPKVDTGETGIDVAVAQRAGLGFIGRNGLLITEEFGSFVYLGEIVTNIVFEPDKPGEFGCGDCMRCVTACPTKALLGDGKNECPAMFVLSNSDKGMMPEEYRKNAKCHLWM